MLTYNGLPLLFNNSILNFNIGFSPLSLNPSLWLDSADLTVITKDGSNYVTAWNDKSNNNNDFTVSEVDNKYKPVWTSDGLYFEYEAFLESSTVTNLGIYDKYTMYVVLEDVEHTTNIHNIYFCKRYTYSNQDELIFYSAFNLNHIPIFRHNSNTVINENQISITYKNTLGANEIWKFIYNQSTWKAINNEVEAFTESYSTDIIQYNNNKMALGKIVVNGVVDKDNVTSLGKFKLKEIIFYPYELSVDEQALVYTYLNTKWNL